LQDGARGQEGAQRHGALSSDPAGGLLVESAAVAPA
jgi:hypothetical protein